MLYWKKISLVCCRWHCYSNLLQYQERAFQLSLLGDKKGWSRTISRKRDTVFLRSDDAATCWNKCRPRIVATQKRAASRRDKMWCQNGVVMGRCLLLSLKVSCTALAHDWTSVCLCVLYSACACCLWLFVWLMVLLLVLVFLCLWSTRIETNSSVWTKKLAVYHCCLLGHHPVKKDHRRSSTYHVLEYTCMVYLWSGCVLGPDRTLLASHSFVFRAIPCQNWTSKQYVANLKAQSPM